ncbi:LMBR1-like membrane protein [Nesidiocoris tenuis]|uniref:LMBR1-like membrane protein n=1 Tax=Nesidiocoris tenuis TaxID=355587 RepID=A0ABN7ASI9_9HEMI|nr:LMBR1-like membrane protein [Nesidiocoris tenuis]
MPDYGDELDDEYVDDRERLFHTTVRENIIFLLVFVILFILSSTIVDKLRRNDREDYFSNDEDEATVYRVSLYLCVFSLSVTLCAAMLHPVSIISNEVLLLYPKSYYVKWLNHSLIQGIWNLVFLFSNVSLFGLLPFAYLFTESEGLSGCRRGVKSRIYETCTVLVLLAFIVFGLTFVMATLADPNDSYFSFDGFGISFLPFLYSCISFFGVLLLLVSTPLGFTSLFGIVSRYLVKPQFLLNVDSEFFKTQIEEDLIQRRLANALRSGKSYIVPEPMTTAVDDEDGEMYKLQNGALQSSLQRKLAEIQDRRKFLEKQKYTSSFQRNVVYPIAMLALLALTAITTFLVLVNSLQLLIGVKAVPKSTAQFTLGLTSLSKLGTVGAVIEVLVIFYLIVTSYVGIYSLPFLKHLRPRQHKTPLSLLISNCGLLLILSSALPLLARTLGITNFDLLGHFGRIEWLGNFKIVFMYNLLFASVTTLCLVNKLTAPVVKELLTRLHTAFRVVTRRASHSSQKSAISSLHEKED